MLFHADQAFVDSVSHHYLFGDNKPMPDGL
jgi:hypothetical protein